MTRWRRYGKDRLYVKGNDGTQIGWRDLLSGIDHVEVSQRDRDYRRAVTDWLADHALSPDGVGPIQPPAVRPTDNPLKAERLDPPRITPATTAKWADLAGRPAGAMARDQAVAQRQAAPVRTALARVLGVHTDERAWRIGADGEEKVAEQLQKLAKKDPRWRFLNAIPVGDDGSDIDHLAIGPGGAFTINAKHHPRARIWVSGNTIMVNGARTNYVRNSRHEATRAARLLSAASHISVDVTGVVVPVNAHALTVKNQPDEVRVVPRIQLVSWLLSHHEVLGEPTIAAVFDAARRSTTWRPRRQPEGPT